MLNIEPTITALTYAKTNYYYFANKGIMIKHLKFGLRIQKYKTGKKEINALNKNVFFFSLKNIWHKNIN
jgi:hypothetical protein